VDGRWVDDVMVGLRGRGIVVGRGEGGGGLDLGSADLWAAAAAPPSSASAQRQRAAPPQVLVLLLVNRWRGGG
jgi:hypothetical protein